MMKRLISLLFHSLLLVLLSAALANPVFAKVQKFVYVYNSDGNLLQPLNAATKCPNPDGGNGVASRCAGVEVDDKGNYSCRFAQGVVNDENLVFVANEYEYIAAGEKGAVADEHVACAHAVHLFSSPQRHGGHRVFYLLLARL